MMGLWVVLFFGLLVAHLLVSWHQAGLPSKGIPLPAPAPGPGPDDLYVGAALTILAVLFIIPKTRRLANAMFYTGLAFGVLAFGWYETLTAYFASDLQDYTEHYTAASEVLLVALVFIVSICLIVIGRAKLMGRLTQKRIGWLLLGAAILLGLGLQWFGAGMFSHDKQGAFHLDLTAPFLAVAGLFLILKRK